MLGYFQNTGAYDIALRHPSYCENAATMPNTATEMDLATMKEDIANLQQDSKATKEENEARFLALEREQVKGYDKLTISILKFPIFIFFNI